MCKKNDGFMKACFKFERQMKEIGQLVFYYPGILGVLLDGSEELKMNYISKVGVDAHDVLNIFSAMRFDHRRTLNATTGCRSAILEGVRSPRGARLALQLKLKEIAKLVADHPIFLKVLLNEVEELKLKLIEEKDIGSQDLLTLFNTRDLHKSLINKRTWKKIQLLIETEKGRERINDNPPLKKAIYRVAIEICENYLLQSVKVGQSNQAIDMVETIYETFDLSGWEVEGLKKALLNVKTSNFKVTEGNCFIKNSSAYSL